MTAKVHGGMSGRDQGSTARKRAESQSWHGFATSGLSVLFVMLAGSSEAIEKAPFLTFFGRLAPALTRFPLYVVTTSYNTLRYLLFVCRVWLFTIEPWLLNEWAGNVL